MKITLKDGSVKEYSEAKSIIDIAKDISEGLARVACAGEINGELVDLRTEIEGDCELNIITATDPKALYVIRHTASGIRWKSSGVSGHESGYSVKAASEKCGCTNIDGWK